MTRCYLLVPEEHANRAAGWLTWIMEDVGDSVVHGEGPPEKRVPTAADKNVCISWVGKQ
jgi:hypothetical protein